MKGTKTWEVKATQQTFLAHDGRKIIIITKRVAVLKADKRLLISRYNVALFSLSVLCNIEQRIKYPLLFAFAFLSWILEISGNLFLC